MLKKIFAGVGLVGLLVGGLSLEDYAMRTYTRTAIVTGYYEDNVFVKDTCDNEWTFIGDDFEVGDNVSLTMDNNHTSNIEDDIIVNAKIVGKD